MVIVMQQQKRANFSPQALRQMRKEQRMSLKQFWGAVGYTSSRGCAYETDRTELPEHARRLIYLEYVAGIPTDIDSERFAQFEAALKASNPTSLTHTRQALESSISAMQNALARIDHE